MKLNTKFLSFHNLIPLIIYGSMIKYIVDLENSKLCPCSNTKNRTMLKKTLIGWIIVSLGFMLLSLFFNKKYSSIFNKLGLLSVIVSLILFIYFSILFFKYENEMYKSNCDCSVDIKKTIFKYYIYSIYVIIFLQIIFALVYVMILINMSNLNRLSVVKVDL